MHFPFQQSNHRSIADSCGMANFPELSEMKILQLSKNLPTSNTPLFGLGSDCKTVINQSNQGCGASNDTLNVFFFFLFFLLLLYVFHVVRKEPLRNEFACNFTAQPFSFFFLKMGNVSNGNTQTIREGKKTFLGVFVFVWGGKLQNWTDWIYSSTHNPTRKGVCWWVWLITVAWLDCVTPLGSHQSRLVLGKGKTHNHMGRAGWRKVVAELCWVVRGPRWARCLLFNLELWELIRTFLEYFAIF